MEVHFGQAEVNTLSASWPFHSTFFFFFGQVPAVELQQQVASSATLWGVPQVAGCLLQLLCRPRKLGFLRPSQQLALQLAGRHNIGSSQPLTAAKQHKQVLLQSLKPSQAWDFDQIYSIRSESLLGSRPQTYSECRWLPLQQLCPYCTRGHISLGSSVFQEGSRVQHWVPPLIVFLQQATQHLLCCESQPSWRFPGQFQIDLSIYILQPKCVVSLAIGSSHLVMVDSQALLSAS